jgi:hypothetical protein
MEAYGGGILRVRSKITYLETYTTFTISVLDLRISQWRLKRAVSWVVTLYSLGKDLSELHGVKTKQVVLFLLDLLKFESHAEIRADNTAKL